MANVEQTVLTIPQQVDISGRRRQSYEPGFQAPITAQTPPGLDTKALFPGHLNAIFSQIINPDDTVVLATSDELAKLARVHGDEVVARAIRNGSLTTKKRGGS